MTAQPLQQFPAQSVRSVARSHVGRVRQINEDRVLDRPDAALWAVADGMGGQAGGAEAATCVIDGLAAVEHGSSGPAFLDDIALALEAANRSLHGTAGPSGGSTVVALLIHEGHYACIWAGDSRAYRLRGGKLQAITRDHSIVQQMVDRGTLTEAERRGHPGGHVITRAIGVQPQVKLDRQSAAVMNGDLFLLCSDGLPTCVQDNEIAAMLDGPDLDGAADRLLALALERGAPDNVSVVLVAVSGD